MSILSSDIKAAFDQYTILDKRRVKCKHCNWDVAKNLTRQKTHLERDCEEYKGWRISVGAPLALPSEKNAENRENDLNTEYKESKRRKTEGIRRSIEELENKILSPSESTKASKQLPISGIQVFRTTPRALTEPLASNNLSSVSLDVPVFVPNENMNSNLEEHSINQISSESLEIRERNLELAERELDLRQRRLQVRREELELMRLEKEILSMPK